MTDVIVVGAGFSGAVIAERAASVLKRRVLVIEQRPHVGGNAHDFFGDDGLYLQRYGPHAFHTSSDAVWNYLSRFTEWRLYRHRVNAMVDGISIPLPVNRESITLLYGRAKAAGLCAKLEDLYGKERDIALSSLRSSRDEEVKGFGEHIFQKIYLNYSRKQWGLDPDSLDASVLARVPLRLSGNGEYFRDIHQGIPSQGFTRLIERMLDSPRIEVIRNADYRDLLAIDLRNRKICCGGREFPGQLVFTGKLDTLCGQWKGPLPYRTLDFEFERPRVRWFQQVASMNYPNEHAYTRLTEFKHMTGPLSETTVIVKEYPRDCLSDTDVPCYPVPRAENAALCASYRKMLEGFDRLVPAGRLAEYRYLDMDRAVANALQIFEERFL